MNDDSRSIIQLVFQQVQTARRPISVREIAAALPNASASAITFSLSRLVREDQVRRISQGVYEYGPVGNVKALGDSTAELDAHDQWFQQESLLTEIFKKVQPVLEFKEFITLYQIVSWAKSNRAPFFDDGKVLGDS